MKIRKCYCAICSQDHEIAMDNELMKEMLELSGVTDQGRLKIACEKCVPMDSHPFMENLKNLNREIAEGFFMELRRCRT